MRKKFVYSCSIKIHISGFKKFFLHLAGCGNTFPAKGIEMLEVVVVWWWEVMWIQKMRQKFIVKFIQFLKCWLCDMGSGIVMEKNWAHSVDWCQLQVLQFLVHLVNLLSILLRCNGFSEIQKAVVAQTSSSRPPNSDHELFFGGSLEQVWLSLEFLLTELAVVSCCIISTFHHMSQPDGEMVHCYCTERRQHFKITIFKNFWSAHEATIIEYFHLSNLLQMTSGCRMVNVEFFGNFSCTY